MQNVHGNIINPFAAYIILQTSPVVVFSLLGSAEIFRDLGSLRFERLLKACFGSASEGDREQRHLTEVWDTMKPLVRPLKVFPLSHGLAGFPNTTLQNLCRKT